jgi:hypothetical protein
MGFWDDISSDISGAEKWVGNQLKNPYVDLGLAGVGTALTLGLAGPELFGGAAVGTADAVGAGAGAPLDILAGSTAEGTAGLETLGSSTGLTGLGGAGLAPDLTGAVGYPGYLPGLTASGAGSETAASAYASGGAYNPGTGVTTAPPASGPGQAIPGAPPANPGSPAPPGGGAGVTTSAAPPGTGGPADLTSSIWNGVKTYGGPALGAAGLAYNLYENKTSPVQQNTNQMQAIAGQQTQSGLQLQQYLATGTLPPALQAQLNQQTQDGIAALKSKYAAMGLPTDPTQNSALQTDIQALQTQALASAAGVETNLLNTGIQEVGMASNTLNQIAGINQTQTAATAKALANFTASLSGNKGIAIPGTNQQIVPQQQAA